jgi:hypothetical protein
MPRIIPAVLGLLFLVQAALPGNVDARPRDRWRLLGQTTVSDRVDHDVLPVTGARGAFRSIKLEVLDHAVQFRSVKIHFGDGQVQEVEIRDVIPAGGETRAIDVEGRERILRSVEFVYDAQTLLGKRARVRVYGRS